MDYLSILSWVAIAIFVISALPQIWKLARSKSARDVSLWMAMLIALGNLLLLIRSASIRDNFFILNYSLQLILWVAIVVLVVKYGRTEPPSDHG